MVKNLDDIKLKINAYKKRYFTKKMVNGIILLSSICLITYTSVNLLEYFGQFGTTSRKVLFFASFATICFAIYRHLYIPFLDFLKSDEHLSDEEASNQIGQFFPDIKDKLLNSLQLSQLNYSENSLILASIEQKTHSLKGINFSSAINFEESKKYLFFYFGIPIILFLALFLYNSNFFTLSTHRILHFNQEFKPQAPFSFVINNKSLNCFASEDMTISMHFEGKTLPEDVYFVSESGKNLMQKTAEGYSYTLYSIQKNTPFWFEAASFISDIHEIQVLNRPILEGISVELEYPSYLGMKNISSDNIGNISVPEGTKMTWNIKAKYTNQTKFIFDDSTRYETKLEGDNFFQFNKNIKESTDYSLILQNQSSKNKEPIQYSIECIKDKHPSIQIEQFKDTVLFNYLLIGGSISDDHGISALKFYYQIQSDKTNSNKYKVQNIPFNRQTINQNFVYQLPLDSINLKPGETLSYFVSVWDNDGVNGAKQSKSVMYHFDIPSENELEDIQEKQSENNKNQLEEALQKAAKLNKELDKINDELKTKRELSWQEKKDIEKILQQHRELQSEIQQLQEQVSQNKEQNERFEQPNPELEDKLRQLEKLMEQMLDPETQKLMEELQKLMNEETSVEELNKKLEELSKKDETFEKEIDRTLEMYKQMEFEKKLTDNIDKLEKLAEKQEELQKKTSETQSKEELQKLNEEQKEISKEFNELKKDMDKLNELNNELENKKELGDLSKEEQNVEENLNNAEEQLNKGNQKNAGQSQKNAGDKMKSMAKKMSEMKESQDMEELEMNIEELKAIMDNLIKLSFKQETVINKLSGLSTRDPQYIEYAQQQLQLQPDADALQQKLYELAKKVPEIEAVVTKEVSEMKNNLDEASEHIKQKNMSRAPIQQQKAMTNMNNLALMLDDILDQLQDQMSQQKPGDQQCQKPGNKKPGKSGQPKPKMGDMQKQLNDMIQKLQQGQKDGKKMGSELAKAAARQEMLRRGLQEMQNKSSLDGKQNSQQQQDLKKLEKAMEETEKELLNNQLSEKTIKRQQDILTRLLEAENAERERDLDTKRKATEAKDQTKTSNPDYSKYLKEKQKQIELLQSIPPTLSPYYKEKVNEYFKNIELN